MTTPVNFRVKNGLTVANGVAVTAGNVVITNGSLVIGGTAVNSSFINTAADNAYANGVNYTNGKAADAYGNAVTIATDLTNNAYSNAVTFAANATNLTNGTLPLERLPATVNVATALNVSNTVSLESGNVSVTNGNDVSSLTSSRISFTDSLTESTNTYYAAVSHDKLVTEKTYTVANVIYADYGEISRAGMFAVVGLDTTNSSIYVRGVTVNTSVISIGNTSAFTAINSTAMVGNGALLTSINAETVGGNSASDLRTYTETYASNATNLTSGTVNSARLPAANATVAGATLLVDSVSNTSMTAAASAASVKTAYDAAITANTNAASALANASTAYTNAINIAANADNLTAGTVNINRIPTLDLVNNTSISHVATANSVKTAYDAAINAYSNAVSYTDGAISAANVDGAAATAYTNAITIAANATNLTSGTVNIARIPTVDAVNNTSITLIPVANNVKTAYDAAIAANTLANTAATAASAAYTNAVAIAANATNLTSGTVNSARLPSGNSSTAGAVVLVDSVSNTSTTAAATAASVKTAYDAAITANTNANTALTAAGAAYTNAVSYTDGAILAANVSGAAATAYANAVSYTDGKINTANAAITGNAATAYTNAIAISANADNLTSGTVNINRIPAIDAINNTSISFVATANSVKTAYDAAITANTNANTALTAAGSAYSNAVTYTDTKIGTANTAMAANAAAAYSNAVTYTDGKIATANGAITGNAATAYTNSVSYTDTKIGTANTAMAANAATAYTNAVSYTDTKIGTANTAMAANAAAAYTNATIFAANASNANNGTLAEARLPFRMDQNLRTSDSPTFANGSFTGSVSVGGDLTITGNLISTNIESFSVSDPLIKLGVDNPGDTYWGGFTFHYSGSGNTTNHAGLVRSPSSKEFLLMSTFGDETAVANNNTINISDPTFSYANLTVNLLRAGNATVFSTINATSFSGTANNATNATNALTANNSTNFGGLSLATVQGQITGNAATAYTNAVSYTDTKIGTANSAITGNAATAYSNAVSYTDTKIGTANTAMAANAATAYTNAIAIAANATNLTSGTVAFARLPSAFIGTTAIQSSSAAQALSGITTLAAGNTTITGFANVSGNMNAATITYSGSLTTTNTALFTAATGSTIFGVGSAIVSANTQGGRTYEGSHNFNSYPNLYTSIFINPGTATNLPTGLTGNAYRFVMGAGDVASRGFDLVGTGTQLFYRARETGDTAWYQTFTTSGGTITGVTTLSANIVMANNAITRPVLAGYTEHEVANTSTTGSYSLDCGAANFWDLTLTGNTTIAPTNVPPSTRMWAGTLVAKQDATGGRTITWPSGSKYPGGVAPPATTTANAIDIWSLMTYDGGTSWIVSLTVKGAA